MGWIDDLKVKTAELVQSAVLNCKASAAEVNADAHGQSLSAWRTKHVGLAVAAAGGNLIGGPVAFAALAIEIPALLNIMSRASLGIGTITTGAASDDDYEAILAVWAGAVALDGDLLAATRAHLAGGAAAAAGSNLGGALASSLAGSAGTKAIAKAAVSLNTQMLSSAVAAIVGKKLMLKGGSKLIASKIAAKIVASLPTRFMPIVGAAVAGTINAWFLNSLMDAAERYYGFLGEAAGSAPELLPA
ncbi:hypothetical protein [Caulobacter soli]|uniref:hypothetical protein n=1 Tax=Caulobacter soli TaxID=2708539 RepID=UPI0013E9DB49|nr:hypothetical protein [Caulobacter soli]